MRIIRLNKKPLLAVSLVSVVVRYTCAFKEVEVVLFNGQSYIGKKNPHLKKINTFGNA